MRPDVRHKGLSNVLPRLEAVWYGILARSIFFVA